MNYKETINWLDGFQKFGIKLGLERITYICNTLDNPQNNYKTIHVGGTNGKGSVCKYLGSILKAGGYKTGVYLSPHLQRFSERILLDGKEISEKDIVSLVVKIKPIVDEMVKNDSMPTYFEIVTAMAFQYFSDKKADFAVIEVGLGGRFDATNIVEPVISVITNVTLEHEDILGKKVEQIAFEKAGIIKKNIPVITGAKGPALKVIQNIAKERNATIYVIDNKKWKRVSFDLEGQEFFIKGLLKDYSVKTKMLGLHQGENIALTLTAVEQLQMNGFYITDDSIIDGIEKAFNPGRMEVISRKPCILLDGAHNPAGMKVLEDTLRNDFEYEKLILVLGILSDKNIKEILKIIVPLTDIIVTTKSCNPRACDPPQLKKMIEDLKSRKEIVARGKIKNAIDYAKSIAKKDDLICITGSLFTVGEAKDYLVKNH